MSDDATVLTLTVKMTVDNTALKVKDATVTVLPVESKANEEVLSNKYVGLLTYEDKIGPAIDSVEAKTSGAAATTATVYMSEPVKPSLLVKVNGAFVSPTTFTGTSDTLQLTGLNLKAGDTHTIEVLNAEDLAGNKVVSQTATFTVAVDSVAPTATVSVGGNDKEILVTFSKAMKTSTVNGISIKDEALADVTVGEASEVANSGDKQFTITIADEIYNLNRTSREFSVVLPKDMEDTLGNKTVASIQKVILTKDATKPVATGYNVVKNADGEVEAIEITFSEGLYGAQPTTGTNLHAAAPTIVNANGVLENNKFINYSSKNVVAGAKKVVFEAPIAEAITGKFAFSFAAGLVKDQSEAMNTSAAFNFTIDFGAGAPTTTTFNLVDSNIVDSVKNEITITYPEAVKGGAVAGSATDLANYTLAGKPLPTGTTIYLAPGQVKATITLPDGSFAKDDTVVFTVSNVQNTLGTKTVKPYAGTVDLLDNTAPVLQSARVINSSAIELTYDEAMYNLSLVDATSAFEIKVGTETYVATLSASRVPGFDKKITLTLGTELTTEDLAKAITVETKEAVVSDEGENLQKAAVKVTVAK